MLTQLKLSPMKIKQLVLIAAFAGITLASCGGNTSEKVNADSAAADSTAADTSMVKPADSTHSFRNDRGTDSVSAGKSVPGKP